MRTGPKSAERALALLEALAGAQGGLSFTDLQRQLRWPKSSLHHLLAALTTGGYIELSHEERVYRLGVRVWEIGQAYLHQHELLNEARPVMERICHAVNETVQLAILDGIENVYLAKVDSAHPVRLQSEVGKRLYAHATGLGKVLLAALSEGELTDRLVGRSLPAFTPHTVTDHEQLKRVLSTVRHEGFALDNEEYSSGLRCVGVPIRDHHERVVAAMSVSIPLMRAGEAQLADALTHLAAGGIEVSRRLGCPQQDPNLAALRNFTESAVAIARWMEQVQGSDSRSGAPVGVRA